MNSRRIEFFISPNGVVMYEEEGQIVRQLTEKDRELIDRVLELAKNYYPEAFDALSKMFATSKPNLPHYLYLMAHKFIRCNFGRFDGLTWDIDGDVMHIEDIVCPARLECPMAGIICRPKPFGLTAREKEIASMSSSGSSYDEISERLGISHSTIKNTLQIIRKKLGLCTSKDITKIFTSL